MVAQAQDRRLTVREWRELLRASGQRYEYSDGWVTLMAGGTLSHATIGKNAVRAIEDALGERPCWLYTSDAAVRLAPNEYRFPDVTVTCAEEDQPSSDRTEVASPRICLEVLSKSTAKEDTTDKAELYRSCPSLQEYGFIGTRRQVVEIHRRTEHGWVEEIYGPAESVQLASIAVEVPVAAFYRQTDVPLVARKRRSAGEH